MSPSFPKMAEIVPEGTSGNVQVKHVVVSEAESKFTALRSAMHGNRGEYVPPGKYAQIIVGGVLMMSDTPNEHRTNWKVLQKAHGDVLIGGLGLGMITHAIAAKPEVTSVTVIEKSPDVIKLIGPTLPPKVRVIQGDVFTWKPEKGTLFDVLYFDIWSTICTDNLRQMATLHRRFARSLRRDHGTEWMGSWCHDLLLYRRRQEHRMQLKKKGWSRDGTKDFCPNCTERRKEEAAAEAGDGER
jgi:hypothetical protein